MKPATKAQPATKAAQPASKKPLTHEQRVKIAKSAAANAWSFMKSRAYQAIKSSNRTDAQKRTAIEALKAKRAA
jgi:hypothetical protein